MAFFILFIKLDPHTFSFHFHGSAVGWLWGYIEKNFTCTFYSWAVGVGLSVLVSSGNFRSQEL